MFLYDKGPIPSKYYALYEVQLLDSVFRDYTGALKLYLKYPAFSNHDLRSRFCRVDAEVDAYFTLSKLKACVYTRASAVR